MADRVDVRLIALDLDGTLLDPSGALTPRTCRAIGAAARRGIRVVLATARRFTGTLPVAEQLGAVDALIVYDGAQARAHPAGSILFSHALPAAIGQRAAEVVAAHALQPIAQHGDASGERLLAAPAAPGRDWASSYLEHMREQVRAVPLERVCAGQPDALRVVAFGPTRTLRQVARALTEALPINESIRGEDGNHPVSLQREFATQLLPRGSYGTAELTVFAPGASKGAALAQVAARYGIRLAQTMAIGDGLNDISMLKVVGLAVAMGTAPRVVRRAAHVITCGNDDDGAARAIEQYALGRPSSAPNPAALPPVLPLELPPRAASE